MSEANMETCEIRWINHDGQPTPDSNPSVGRIRTKARVESYPHVPGGVIRHDASDWFHVCAEHAKRLRESGMHIWEWETETLGKAFRGEMN